jgi:hypothetical protein
MSNEIIGVVQYVEIIGNIASNPEINVQIIGSGASGKDGVDGYTPQKGVDYYTEAEKQELIASLKGDAYFIFEQMLPSGYWIVTHNLGKNPSVTVVDSAGTVVIGEIQYISNNELTLTFSGEFSGKAYLN